MQMHCWQRARDLKRDRSAISQLIFRHNKVHKSGKYFQSSVVSMSTGFEAS